MSKVKPTTQDTDMLPQLQEAGETGGLAMARRAVAYIEQRVASFPEGPVTLDELAAHCGLSPWHLQRQFKRLTGVTPRQYDDALRLKRLQTGLKAGNGGVAGATFDAGYGSSSRVYERADAALGMTPASYAKGGRGASITYGIASSALGLILVAATERGLCRVELGDREADLIANLQAEFPAALEIERNDRTVEIYMAELMRRMRGDLPHADLPLDIQATAFQRRVWEELNRIPRGETRSYGEIAAAIGQPGAARAVGQACGANPVALAIPCHRALRNDGNIGGYAWGIERKQTLISAERGQVYRNKSARLKKGVSG
ncbi:bifunctional transcriptional activator/DNA repair enzyme AdaA [Dongia soli]|uniref:Methylated-DNA--[protein]-cysteine S-methyltransferase n=1 Tax=Dongia soli TaxID=600628 RepID=A0ABU5E557_9PROT|nr:methylated-DNA--[protein]-cysteine S-methyltransferase [Dongia soli]MDY0881400.1 methylated-DNA--[protein]-cysteine S-methyltransferase [Dongia soli]